MKQSGYFRSVKEANKAIEYLNSKGYKAYLDLNDQIQNLSNAVHANGMVQAPTLSSLVMNSADFSRDDDVSPLAAASPMASGMGGFEEIADINAKIEVEGQGEEIKEIIERMGGTIEGPGVDIRQCIEE